MTEAFSVVMPIHNEEKLLPYSLPSVYALNPDEVVLIFDRCSDHSVSTSKRIAKCCDAVEKTKFIYVTQRSNWSSQLAFVRAFGYEMCDCDTVLNTDADIVLHPNIKGFIANPQPLVVFERIDYPTNARNLVIRLLQRTPLKKLYQKVTGIYLFSKKTWRQTCRNEGLRELEGAEDTYLQTTLAGQQPMKFVLSKCIHLRPTETKKYHYTTGRRYWTVAHRTFAITLLTAIFLLRPALAVGYVHARWH